MKIGFLLDDHLHRPGGIQEHVRGLYRYLERQGHQAVIFAGGAQHANSFPERVIQLGRSLPIKGSGSWTTFPLTLQRPATLRRLLRQEACDVLDVQSPFSPTMSGRLLARSDAAHVMTFLIRIDERWRLRLFSLAALLQRPGLRRFHLRIAISASAIPTARALYGGDEYLIIPDAVEVEEFMALPRATRSLAGGPVTILCVGRLEQRKGQAHLIRAFAQLEREHGAAVRLLIAGEGPERAMLEQLVRGLGLEQVRFLGYVGRAELPELMAGSDIFCAPATGNESFGRVLIEALAAGLPIVAAGNAGYRDTLRSHPLNMVVAPGDDRALAGALGAFVASPALRHRASQQNRQDAQRYSWESVGAQYVRAYQQALERKQRQEAGRR